MMFGIAPYSPNDWGRQLAAGEDEGSRSCLLQSTAVHFAVVLCKSLRSPFKNAFPKRFFTASTPLTQKEKTTTAVATKESERF